MLEVATILERIDRIAAELAELRAAVAGADADERGVSIVDTPADDLAPEHLIEISTAVERFNRPADSLRWLCRQRDCGRKIGGRWMVSVPRLARYLNGGG